MVGRKRGQDAHRITSATPSRSEDVDSRAKRYLISMAIRTICFIAAAVVAPHWSMWAFLLASLVLPYVAVVAANVGTNTDPDPLPPVEPMSGSHGRELRGGSTP
jgi:hypothetical protein